MLRSRVITAVILIPAVVAAILLLPTVWFAAVTSVFILCGAWEWAGLSGFEDPAGRAGFVAAMLVLLGGLVWYLDVGQLAVVVQLAGLWWLLALVWVVLFERGRAPASGLSVLRALCAAVVLVPAWLALVMLHTPAQGPWLVLGVMLVVWAADIGAYFAGRRFGRHKLAPAISPGKSIEGVVGGMLAAALVAVVFARVGGISGAGLGMVAGAGSIIALVSVLGDLFESMIKRMAGKKDSGTLLPGHGGVLDRIDSLTAAFPIAVLALPVLGLQS